jgi:aspartate kinase
MSLGIVVQKFGGSSVADTEKLFNVARRIIGCKEEGNKVVVVVSAQGKTTDCLLGKAKEITDTPNSRELDLLLSSGEQVSSCLLALTLQKMGHSAISFTGARAGIETDNNYGDAQIINIDTKNILKELENGNIVIVAGFQGVNQSGEVTTLGRGGSDTTAVALSAYLNADRCETYTDVNGVYTADPRIVKNVKRLDVMSYDEMLELARLGAKVLHDKSVQYAKKFNVELYVKSSFHYDVGTVICDAPFKDISGITKMKNRVSVVGVKAEEYLDKILKHLENENIIVESFGRGDKYISIVTDNPELAMNKIHDILFPM